MRLHRAEFVAAAAACAVALAAFLRGRAGIMVASSGALHPYYHVGIFGVIAFIATCSTRSVARRVLLCVAVAAFGGSTELIEWYWNGLGFEWTDVVLDTMGAAGGTALAALIAEFAR